MKISTKCRYGIRAVLVIARNYDKVTTRRKDISAEQNIPNSYLENILIALKHGKIVTSVRGASGGFTLRRPPSEITLLHIFEALQGSISLLDCLDSPDTCDRSAKCIVRPIWVEMQEAQKNVLEKTTVEDLLEKDVSDLLGV